MNKSGNINSVGRFLLLKRYVASVLFHPIFEKLIGFVFNNRIPHRGSRILVPEGGGVNAALFWGAYESAEIRFVRGFLDGSFDVVELGASLGGVSCEIARKIAKDRKLICIEANPQILGLLQKNLIINVPDKNFRVIHGAINYDSNNQVNFAIGNNTLGSHLGSEGQVMVVPSITLSRILESESICEFALVCDIEGAEVQIFKHDLRALSGCRILIIELHSVDYQGEKYNPDDLVYLIECSTSMRLVARYGSVCVFVR